MHVPLTHCGLAAITYPPPPPPISLQGSIDSSKVTCVKWVPASETSFVSSHRSGNLFVWSTEFTGKSNGPQNYTLCKELQDASIYAVKPKNKSPVLFRWNIGHGAINNFAFSPDVTHIAIASQDGFLRIYNFKTQEFYGRMRSYFGGFLCICWSPDGRYAVTGGEDDLITVWSFEQRRVVARGEGHKSYVSFVAFDPYTTVLPDTGFSSSAIADSLSGAAQRELLPLATSGTPTDRSSTSSGSLIGRAMSDAGERERCVVAYRLGSVGQDTQLCLWDLSGDALKPRRTFLRSRSRASRIGGPQTSGEPPEGAPPPTAAQESAERDRKSVDLESAGNDALHGDSGKSPSAADGKDSYSPPAPGDKIASSLHSKAATVNHTSASGHQPSGTPASDEFAPSASSSSLTEKRSSRARSALKHLSGTAETNGPPREEDNESSPSVGSEQSASERTNGKKEKKHRKDKEKKGTRIREPVKKVMRFVGNISGGGNHHHHAYRREVGTFESCNSDDIAPKMHEVNLIEPLVAKKIGHERLTVLVFREDCIVAAGQDGFVHTWSRPGFELPEETKDDAVSSRPFRGSVTSNPPGVRATECVCVCVCVRVCMPGCSGSEK